MMLCMQETMEFFNLYLNMSFIDVSHYYAFIHELLQMKFFIMLNLARFSSPSDYFVTTFVLKCIFVKSGY